MRTEKEVLELRGELHTEMKDILNRAHKEKRAVLPDEEAQWEKANADYLALTKELNMIRANAQYDLQLEQELEENPILKTNLRPDDKESEEEHVKKYWHKLLTGPPMSRSDAMRLAYSDGPQKAQTTTTTGEDVIPLGFMRELEVYMIAFGGMLNACRTINTMKGNAMEWPSMDDTAQTGAWVSEPRSSGLTSRAFTPDKKTFNSFVWADLAQVTWEFIQDEDVNFISQYLAEFFGTAAGRALNQAFTDGNGSGKPTGVLDPTNGASTGKTTAGATAITKGELVDLLHSVDPAYRSSPKTAWMMHDSTVGYIQKLDVGTDTGLIWQPSLQAGIPDRIMGYPVVVNQSFPIIASGADTIAFGDWSKYIIRKVRQFSMVRLQERFADQLSDGFLGWMRYEGKLNNTAAIKLLTQA